MTAGIREPACHSFYYTIPIVITLRSMIAHQQLNQQNMHGIYVVRLYVGMVRKQKWWLQCKY